MTESPVSRQQLIAENAALRARLDDTEATLRAIQGGEADALVLTGTGDDHIHTMKGALEPYRIMVEAMGEGAVTLSPDGTLLYCNNHFAEWIKLPRAQIAGMSLRGMIAKPEQQRFDAMLPRGTQEVVRETLTLQAADGTQTPALFSLSPLPQSEGRMISAVITDLSEVAAATAARTRLALIVDSSDDGIVSTTLEGVVQSWNRAAEQLFGYSTDEAIGQPLQTLTILPEQADVVSSRFAAIRRGEHTERLESMWRRKDDSLIEVSVIYSPILDPSGAVVGASINTRDITERRRIQKDRDWATFLLGERLKELSCLHAISTIFSASGLSVDQRLQQVVDRIPAGFTHPGTTCARITRKSEQYRSADFKETAWRLVCVTEGECEENGSLEVFYTDEIPTSEKGPFLQEEKALVDTIGRNIDDYLRLDQTLSQLTRFRDLLDASRDAVFVVDPASARIVDINRQACDALGYSRDELLRLHVVDMEAVLPTESAWDDHVREIKKVGSMLLEGEEKRKDGSTFPVEVSVRYVSRDKDDYIVAIARDITERKKSEARIKYLNRVLSVLSVINSLIVRVNDREELLREACNIAVKEGGFRIAMIMIIDPDTMQPISTASAGKDDELLAAIKDVMSSNDSLKTTMVAQAMKEKKAVIANNTQNDTRLLFGKQYVESGVNSMTVVPLMISGKAVGTLALYANETDFFHEDEMKLLTELADDIAYAIDHIDKQERLNYLAYYDVLTGLANRSLFLDRLTQYMHSAISRGHKVAIGMIDVARFKNINDSLGRPAGDSLLKQVAEWLTQFTKNANQLARIDADHFAIVLPKIMSDGNLTKLVENMMAAFQEHSFILNDATFRIDIKVGIAVFPDDGDNVDSLYTNAEAALKKAKRSGDRHLFYTQKMTETVADKLSLENQLRRAIDNEEFVLYYQPKVNLMSGKVTSAEALIRWNDPITGLVPPGKFIPMLEETGMILEVGRWALQQAIKDTMRWRATGLTTVRIAVNMSQLQLRNINFVDEVRQMISLDMQVAGELELEITESLIMDNVEQNITTLKAIRAMGITIAIDDFGTGFSSLNYLSKLPVNTLKIDRSFVIEMEQSAGMALVTTIIMMAHALNLTVVAEGVETEQQMRQLLSLNCDEMQGFLFSKPVPADIFAGKFLAPVTPDDKQS